MKINLLGIVVLSIFLLPLHSQAESKIYGKVHLNYGFIEDRPAMTTSQSNYQLNSYASRFGVKGSRDLASGFKAIYKLEWEVNPDDDDTKTVEINNRNQYIGIKGHFGELRFGTHDTPLKKAQGKFDQFGDTLADLKHAGSMDGEHRFSNMLLYMGKTENITYKWALLPGEGDGLTGGDGPADTISASIAYKSGPIYLAIASDSYDDTGAKNLENSLFRIVGTYRIKEIQLGLLLQSGVEKLSDSNAEEKWLGLSLNSKLSDGNKFKAQYITVENSAAIATKSNLLAVGIDHYFDQKTLAYVMVSSFEKKTDGQVGDERDSVSIGMQIKF